MSDWRANYGLTPNGEKTQTSRAIFESSRDRLYYRFRTPFEDMMVGGSPPGGELLQNRTDNTAAYHIPLPILKGEVSIAEANYVRSELGHTAVSSFSLGFYINPNTGQKTLGYEQLKDKMLIVSVEPLDPETGVTIRDPQILGVWDEDTKTIKPVEGRDLNAEYYQIYKQFAENHPDNEMTLWRFARPEEGYPDKETLSYGDTERS